MERLKELLPRIIRSFSIPALRSQEKVTIQKSDETSLHHENQIVSSIIFNLQIKFI